MKKLYLASASPMRRQLLREAGIDHECVAHTYPEDVDAIRWQGGSIQHDNFGPMMHAVFIAGQKMAHVALPASVEGERIMVVTADSLVQLHTGEMCGKPKDTDDARRMLRMARKGLTCLTAFECLWFEGMKNEWEPRRGTAGHARAKVYLEISDEWIERYLRAYPDYMHVAGALQVEGFGAQFVRSIEGSYTAILGLPMVELRCALESLEFFVA